jgi:hypothetical protein
MDGRGPFCEQDEHDAEHGTFRPLPPPKDHIEYLERLKGQKVSPDQRALISRLKRDGHGKRTIARQTGVHLTLVSALIQAEFGKGPGSHVRTRPRAEDRQRALDAGITPEEFLAERVEGGRAQTIALLDAWIAERQSE